MTNNEKIILEATKMLEIYKTGFLDGYCQALGKTDWKKIWKKCKKNFEKRLKKGFGVQK